MRETTKAILVWVVVIILAALAETITVSAAEHPILNRTNVTAFSLEDIDLMARVVQAEYGNGDETDKRLVVSVILNRLESDLPDFKNMNSVEAVVTAPCQFAIAKGYTLETLNAVYKEILERTDERVLWFNTGGYPAWGEPVLEYHAHYFTGVK